MTKILTISIFIFIFITCTACSDEGKYRDEVIYDFNFGEELGQIGKQMSQTGPGFSGMAIDDSGNIYLIDGMNFRIQKKPKVLALRLSPTIIHLHRLERRIACFGPICFFLNATII